MIINIIINYINITIIIIRSLLILPRFQNNCEQFYFMVGNSWKLVRCMMIWGGGDEIRGIGRISTIMKEVGPTQVQPSPCRLL